MEPVEAKSRCCVVDVLNRGKSKNNYDLESEVVGEWTHAMLCYMDICIEPLEEGYSEALS